MTTIKSIRAGLIALAGAMSLASPPAQAVSYAMKAAAFDETLPDGSVVRMWGYRLSVANPTATQVNNLANQTPATNAFYSPGQALVVPPGDSTLSITLINDLPAGQLTSLVIHGLVNGSDPVFATAPDASGTVCTPATGTLAEQRACRLRSLVQETPNGSAPSQWRTYTFNNVPPGTYLYQSGTHQQLQVQMGLYGMMSKEASQVGTQRYAYGSAGAQTGPFSAEVKLLFSELDAGFHSAVASGAYVPAAGASIIDYRPTHHRLHRYNPANGNPVLIRGTYDGNNAYTSNQTLGVLADQPLLVRIANAGLTSRSPSLRDGHWTLLGEDGKPYPYPRQQAVVLLPAAKTTEALFTPHLLASATGTETDIVIFDRRAGVVTTADGRLNGDYIRMRVHDANAIPLLDTSAMSTSGTQGVAYSGSVGASGGSAPYTFSLPQAPAGAAIDPASGIVTWTPNNAQAQKPLTPTLVNTLTVKVDSANGRSATGTVYVAVANVNDAPVAAADAYTVVGGLANVAAAAGVRANDSDPDGNPLGDVTAAGTLPTGVTLNADGSFGYDVRNEAWYRSLGANATQKVSFQYQVTDSLGAASLPGTVTLSVRGHKAPIANADVVAYTLTTTRPPIDIPVLANDTAEAGWTLAANTLTKVGNASMGATLTVLDPATGSACTTTSASCVIRYKPSNAAKKGSESFSYKVQDNFGRWSNQTTVTVNLQ